MAEISITKPLSLIMNITEAEDHLPSLQLTATIKIAHLTASFACQASKWFACADWDQFSTDVATLSLGKKATLVDMSEEFSLTIEHRLDDTYLFTIECCQLMIGIGFTRLSFCTLLDADELAHVVKPFKAFPRWWR